MLKSNKSIFVKFVMTYFIIILLVLACLFPIYNSLEQAERGKAVQGIRDYTAAAVKEMEGGEDVLFNSVRSLYADQELQRLYYSSTRTIGTTLFYNMTQLHQRLQLYYQNIDGIYDVLVYIPKFDYVLTRNYIFRSRDEFYSWIRYQSLEDQDWLNHLPVNAFHMNTYPAAVSDLLVSETPYDVLNHVYSFPMAGDANIKMTVIVSLDPTALAEGLIHTDIRQSGFAVVSDGNGQVLASSGWQGESLSTEAESTSYGGKQYQLLHHKSKSGYEITIGVDQDYYEEIRRDTMRLILKNVGVAMLVSACAALCFAWIRSRPLERILDIIRHMDSAGGTKGAMEEIEDTVLSMITEISQCKNTIRDLDLLVSNNLLEKLFFGEISSGKSLEAFTQYFGTMPDPFIVGVFQNQEEEDLRELKLLVMETLEDSKLPPGIMHQNRGKLYGVMPADPDFMEKMETALKLLRENHGLVIKVGISNSVKSLTAAREAVRQAERRLDASSHIQGVYLLNHTYSSRAVQSFVKVQELDALQRALMTGNQQLCARIISEMFERVVPEKLNSVELRQMFFSLRAVYSTVSSQFALEAERTGESNYEGIRLPNDLDEYSLESVKAAFIHLNQVMDEQYQKLMNRSARIKGMDVLAYVEKNYSDSNLCASSIAEHFDLSEKYVFQLIKGACGETLNDKISFLRVEEGVRLLEQTELSVADIAQRIGFTSSNSMYKVFMRVKGSPPSAYRGKKKK